MYIYVCALLRNNLFGKLRIIFQGTNKPNSF